jgi:hypothetical protein
MLLALLPSRETPQFLERDASAEIAEHDAERRGAAFEPLHLQDGRRPNAVAGSE